MAFVALLDANILWNVALCDTLLRAAERELYRPAWSEEILAEVADSLKAKRPDLDPRKIDQRIDQMKRQFPEALVTGYEDLIPVMTNQEKDRHVLAAAVRVGAGVIVTENTKHFPPEACQEYDLDVQTPDEFLLHLWSLRPEELTTILTEQAMVLQAPPMTIEEAVEHLAKAVPRFAAAITQSGVFGSSSDTRV